MESFQYDGIENLESRRLLSAALLAGHTLLVIGDPGGSNTIDVHYNDAGDQVEVTMSSTSVRGVVKNIDKFFASAQVRNILIRGGKGVDAITVGQSGKTFDILTRTFAVGGNDTITTGAENDFIDAGAGNDIVTSGDGNDTVRGGLGDDHLTVGNGTDRVAGNGGNDIIVAGNGNDSVLGGAGNDSITAGNGNDIFGGILGHNVLMGGTGHNTFYVHSLANNTTNYDPTKDTLVVKPNKGDSVNPSNVS